MKFSVCPRCSGYGCNFCLAGGVLASLDGQVLLWRKTINRLVILQERIQLFIKNAINFIFLVFGLVGILSLVYLLFQVTAKHKQWSWLLDGQDTGHLIFWLSLVGDFFLYYRIEKELSSRKTIIGKKLGAPGKEQEIDWSNLKKAKKIAIENYFSPEAQTALKKAWQLAARLEHGEVMPIHLLAHLFSFTQIAVILGRLGINHKILTKKVSSVLYLESKPGSVPVFSPLLRQVILSAYVLAREKRIKKVEVTELFLASVREDQNIQNLFYDLEIDQDKLNNVVEWIHINKKLYELWQRHRRRARFKPRSHMNRALTARPTPTLDSLGQDFTLIARSGGFFPLIGREKELGEVFRILKEGAGDVLLVGEAGTGKTTILQGVAELMAAEDVPPELQDKRLIVFDPASLIAAARGIGSIEALMERIIFEIARAGNVLLAIEDIHELLGAGTTGSAADAGELLKNYLSQGYLHVIGTTTTPEFHQFIENKETFLRRFQVVNISELNFNEAIQVLESKANTWEYKYKVFYSYEAIEACVKLTDRYIKDRHLPAKALDIMEEAAIFTRETKGEKNLVTREDVAKVLAEKTNIPAHKITAKEADKLLRLEEIMHQRIVGQKAAVSSIAKALRRAREEIRDVTRPIAAFLFLGPTGVGKTETAKTIADVYFNSEEKMIRLDMSEYQQLSALERLIKILCEAVRAKPFSLILLDEFEKAHPDILNVFLQVIDDGRLTEPDGRTIDFTNTMIIATSNAGTQEIQDGLRAGKNLEIIEQELLNTTLKEYFRPELLNRFDEIVLFKPLTIEEVYQVAILMLQKLSRQLETTHGIILEVTEEAVAELAQKGYDPTLGARPLRRLIQNTVDDALAKLLLEGQVKRRDIVVLQPGGNLSIKRAREL